MTTEQFNVKMGKMIDSFKAAVDRLGEEEARAHYRTERRVVYVKTFTVREHFRTIKPKRTLAQRMADLRRELRDYEKQNRRKARA